MRSLRGYDHKRASEDTATVVAYLTDESPLVQQHFQQEVDINTIVSRFGLSRQFPSGSEHGVYGDFTGINDYESAVAAIKRAEDGFLKLDPVVRDRFANDPGRLLEFLGRATRDEVMGAFTVPVAGTPPVVDPAKP